MGCGFNIRIILENQNKEKEILEEFKFVLNFLKEKDISYNLYDEITSISQGINISKFESATGYPIIFKPYFSIEFYTYTLLTLYEVIDAIVFKELFYNLIKYNSILEIDIGGYSISEDGSYFYYCKTLDLFLDAVIYLRWGYNIIEKPEEIEKLKSFLKEKNILQDNGSIILNQNSESDSKIYRDFDNFCLKELEKYREEIPLDRI